MESIREKLRELEERLLHPVFRRDRPAVSALLAEDFVEFGSSGIALDRQQVLELVKAEPPLSIAIDDFRVRELSAGVVLATYRAIHGDHSHPGGAESLRSSVWVWQENRWQMVFHQGTSVAPRQSRASLPGRGE